MSCQERKAMMRIVVFLRFDVFGFRFDRRNAAGSFGEMRVSFSEKIFNLCSVWLNRSRRFSFQGM